MDISTLEKQMRRDIIASIEAEENPEQFAKEVVEHGCISGIGITLDMLALYKKYGVVILQAVANTGQPLTAGLTRQEYHNQWDTDDMGANESNNQNLLAWSLYETIASAWLHGLLLVKDLGKK